MTFAPKFDTGEHAYVGKGDCRCGAKWGTQQHCAQDSSRHSSGCRHLESSDSGPA